MISWSGFRAVGSEFEYLSDAFSSGWVSGGDYVGRLEQALQSSFSGSQALAVSNGTAALQLAYETLSPKRGGEVIVPAFCFQAAANVALQLGLRPVFCDVDKTSWNQTVGTISDALSPNTVGVVVVHNYGVSAPVEDICVWARDNGLWVIEDCAEAWFSTCNDRFVGQYGDVATFSMHATKTIACGEGGVVLVNNPSLYERAALIKSHGLARAGKHYYHSLAGNNFRLSNLLCAIALAQLENKDGILERQRTTADLYRQKLGRHQAIQFQTGLGDGYLDEIWATAIQIDSERLVVSRDQLMNLLIGAGIEVRPGFYSAGSLPYIDSENIVAEEVAGLLAGNVVVLPTNASVNEEQVAEICTTLVDILDANSKTS